MLRLEPAGPALKKQKKVYAKYVVKSFHKTEEEAWLEFDRLASEECESVPWHTKKVVSSGVKQVTRIPCPFRSDARGGCTVEYRLVDLGAKPPAAAAGRRWAIEHRNGGHTHAKHVEAPRKPGDPQLSARFHALVVQAHKSGAHTKLDVVQYFTARSHGLTEDEIVAADRLAQRLRRESRQAAQQSQGAAGGGSGGRHTLGNLSAILRQNEGPALKANPALLQARHPRQEAFDEDTPYILPGWLVSPHRRASGLPTLVYAISTENLLLNLYRLQEQTQLTLHLMCDASHRVTWEGYPVFPMGVVDRNQQFHTVAHFVSDTEDEWSYTKAFAMIIPELERVVQERFEKGIPV